MGWSHAALAATAAILLVACSPGDDKRPRHPTHLGAVVSTDDAAISRPIDAVACDAAEVLLMDGEEMIVSGRVHVVPLEDNRIAIRAIAYGRSGKTAVNQFVLRTNGEVEEVPDELLPVMDRAIGAPLRCKLHGVALVRREETTQVTDWTTPGGYHEAMKSGFPNANADILRINGSLPPEVRKAAIMKGVIRHCPKCREAEKAWLEEHGITVE